MRGRTAGLIAQRLQIICLRRPRITYADLQTYYPPTEVAAILSACYFGGSDDYDFRKWLARHAPHSGRVKAIIARSHSEAPTAA